MFEYLTVTNIVVAIGAVGWAFGAAMLGLRWLAPRTTTRLDDEALAALEQIDRARVWARSYAPYLYQSLEWLAKQDKLPAGSSKAAEFLLRIRDEYRRQHGADLPAQAETEAKVVASALAAADHLPQNPRPAPASR